MRVHLGLPSSPIGPVAVTVGSFDGVHRGHVDVIHRTVAAAAESGARSVEEVRRYPLEASRG